MAIRTIQAPGIEVNEIDRSQYNRLTDYSLPNAPTCLITGFADKGENYKTQWINSKSTFIDQYGYPTNIAETYFYNGAMEILNRGGILLTHKLPYDNDAKDKFTYVEYNFSKSTTIVRGEGSLDIEGVYDTIGDIRDTVEEILSQLHIEYKDEDLSTLGKIVDICYNLQTLYNVEGDLVETIADLVDRIEQLIEQIKTSSTLYSDILISDNTLTSYIEISSCINDGKMMSLDEFDKYLTRNILPTADSSNSSGKMTIVNISNNRYEKTSWNSIKTKQGSKTIQTNDCLGIVPVIVSPANALYYQRLLKSTRISDSEYTILSGLHVRDISTELDDIDDVNSQFTINQEELQEKIMSSTFMSKPFKTNASIYDDTTYDNSWSREFSQYFPTITYNSDSTFDVTHMKKIGILVLKVFQDTANNDTLNFSLLESFVGSVDPTAKNPITHSTEFIDTIVNSNSQYIRVFTNINYKELEKACFIGIQNQVVPSLGFFNAETVKKIDYRTSIVQPLNRMFTSLNNPLVTNIDIVVDAGMTNIAQYLCSTPDDISFISSRYSDVLTVIPEQWVHIAKLFDNFCKAIRKDCMFIVDSPRPLCLIGEQKIVRPSKLENTIENTIVRNLQYITSINSSYTAGYCDWFYAVDEYTRDYFWCPPSIKAAGVYCYTDVYFHTWDAPAGLNRGNILNTYDTAFSPTNSEAGKIYSQCWNYAANYPLNGIILEGQKTFQKNQTALDRVNVRRLMLYLEKQTTRIARLFLYEGNTEYIRNKFVDTLSAIFEEVKNGNGLLDYIIKCDETNNTPTVINNNELQVSIAVKPVKTVEYIVVNFIVTNQSANIVEEVKKL